MRRVLVVDDDRRSRRVLQILLERLELESQAFENPEEALAFLGGETASLILTDLKMPQMDGIAFMRGIRQLDPNVPVIMLTAYGSIETAVEAMKLGAVDYLTKPFDVDVLELLIQRSLDLSLQSKENRYFRDRECQSPAFEDMVGESAPMQEVFGLITRVAPTRSTVLITGETGTGKELVARAIHRLSPRAKRLFVPLNCAAIPNELLESELFGHVRGAFSGAHADREGKFQAADGGTLFLDEIGDMDMGLQAKMLRVLEEGVVQPVGSDRLVSVEVRILSATHRDLEAAMRDGRFREDLFYRLNVFEIRLPKLAERREDIPALAALFLREFGSQLGRQLSLSDEAARLLQGCAWRGNVRELRSVMERAAVLCDDGEIGPEAIHPLAPAEEIEATADDEGSLDLASAVAKVERKTLLRALAATNDNKADAASLLGIGERTLWSKLKKHGL